MYKIPVVLMLLFASFCVLAADGFSSLEEQMSGKEFKAAGLDKLSQSELNALNGWIRSHSVATLDTPNAPAATDTNPNPAAAQSNVDRRGMPNEEKEDRTPINSSLIGSSTGWDGQTVFKLENGMIWAQADKDKFYAGDEIENAAITIDPGMFGKWYLSFDGHKSKCKVVRIQ